LFDGLVDNLSKQPIKLYFTSLVRFVLPQVIEVCVFE